MPKSSAFLMAEPSVQPFEQTFVHKKIFIRSIAVHSIQLWMACTFRKHLSPKMAYPLPLSVCPLSNEISKLIQPLEWIYPILYKPNTTQNFLLKARSKSTPLNLQTATPRVHFASTEGLKVHNQSAADKSTTDNSAANSLSKEFSTPA